jgi:hypothetical protein
VQRPLRASGVLDAILIAAGPGRSSHSSYRAAHPRNGAQGDYRLCPALFTFRSVAGESSFARRPSSALRSAIKARACSIAHTPASGIGIYPLLDMVDETTTRIGRVQSKSRRIIPLPGAACYSIFLVAALPAPGVASPQVSPYPSVFGRERADRGPPAHPARRTTCAGRRGRSLRALRARPARGPPSLPFTLH